MVAHTSQTGAKALATAVTAESGTAGGLVGKMSGGKLEQCAAALYVKGATAGGLVGVADQAEIASSYSGGHTKDGQYLTIETEGAQGRVNVIATGYGGGLVGQANNGASIHDSYSTCSVKGMVAGGFAGAATGTTLARCYATGLVTGADSSTLGAFAGNLNGTAQNCQYYRIVNGLDMEPLGSGSADVTALDANTTSYNTFVGAASAWRNVSSTSVSSGS